jgi:hypothetical protein
MTKNTSSICLAGLLIAAAVSAWAGNEPTPAAAPPVTVAAATTVSAATIKPKPEDKVICKTETPTGSRLGATRTCMKKSEWDEQSLSDRRKRDFGPPAGIAGVH